MPSPLKDLLETHSPLAGGWAALASIVMWFLIAWLVSRWTGRLAARFIRWQDARHRSLDETIDPAFGMHLKRRETMIVLVQAGITTLAFLTAIVFAVAQLFGGLDRLATLAGASFILLLLGFSLQRVLIDIIAGFSMFLERWYSVGDTIIITPSDLQGVVEDVSLRRTKLRALNGEVISVHNSAISGVRVLPHGVKQHAVELFVYDEKEGIALVNAVAQIVPVSSTCFLRRPELEEVEPLGVGLTRLRVKCLVAPGREWLVEGFFLDILKEKGEESLIVHGPVAFAVDERAARSYARAAVGARGRSVKLVRRELREARPEEADAWPSAV